MYLVFRSDDRGREDLGWLKTKYSFSFSNYYNKNRLGFSNLKVLNDDIITKQTGFGFHSHKNMEIVTIMLSGELTHRDNMGNTSVLKENYIQHMSAGTGVIHSEMNFSDKDVHLLQLWISPKKLNVKPIYQEKKIDYDVGETKLVSISDKNNTLIINQNCEISILSGNSNFSDNYAFENTFLFVIDGNLNIFNQNLQKGDSIEISNEKKINFQYNGKILMIKLE